MERTAVRAPFDAIVRSTRVEVGSQVSPQEALAELVGANEYWIQTSVPVDRLKWIRIPRRAGDSGSEARIIYGSGPEGASERKGRIVKLLGDLAEDGRMARVLVSVKDPLDLAQNNAIRSPLLIGEYVTVEITGLEIKDVFKIPRTALRDNGKIWIAGNDDKLHIRPVEVQWRGPEFVLVRDGLKDRERLIMSDLGTPVAGMDLRIEQPGGPGPGKQGRRGFAPPGGRPQKKDDQKRKDKKRGKGPDKTG
ncbi:MAG: HlyD family efflux transporter periplasmic adaptor subunit [Deltaproteobacteria bacterium]|nr:HlyD family efflux transporter periplasmic adaptor subunit [Deltaproteobacteria bacterium]